ncbi:MAG: dUTP diphosphatase [Desulfovibrio sp.]|nr:dUTP diphosphatase [Desulfovibrio sp.]
MPSVKTQATQATQNNSLKLKFRKLKENAVPPKKGTPDSAGFDLVAVSKSFDTATNCVIFGTGLAVEIPKGFVGLLFPRSSVYKTSHALANCVGVIDSDYRGEVKAIFRTGKVGSSYKEGDRVCQLVLVPCPVIELEEVQDLSETERGEGGFGSTDTSQQDTSSVE